MSLASRTLPWWLVVVAVVVACLGTARAAGAARSKVRAAVAGTEPFVVQESGNIHGVSVELFRAIAKDADFDVELVPMPDVGSALAAVERGEVDVDVGPISITSDRAERIRFTQPYFQSSLGIVTPRSVGWLSRVSGFLSRAFLVGLAVLLVVLGGVGTLIWLAERVENPDQFPPRPAAGIANGVWFAIVTMTTVGYGDRVPVSRAGRLIAGVWMVVALISASSLTAGIATAITVAQLATPRIATVDQLAKQRVAAVRGSSATRFVQRARSRLVVVGSVDEGVMRVARGDAEAFVFDRPTLRYYLQNHPELDLVVAEGRYAPQGYGFAIADAALQHTLNVALLRAAENGVIERVTVDWLGRDHDSEP